jgi:hypothetical protein
MTTLLEMLEKVLERAAADEGHVYMTRIELHTRMNDLIDTALRIGEQNGRLVVRGELAERGVRSRALPLDRVYLPHLDAAERECAAKVKRLMVRS